MGSWQLRDLRVDVRFEDQLPIDILREAFLQRSYQPILEADACSISGAIEPVRPPGPTSRTSAFLSGSPVDALRTRPAIEHSGGCMIIADKNSNAVMK
jgi:hypothetical protein